MKSILKIDLKIEFKEGKKMRKCPLIEYLYQKEINCLIEKRAFNNNHNIFFEKCGFYYSASYDCAFCKNLLELGITIKDFKPQVFSEIS